MDSLERCIINYLKKNKTAFLADICYSAPIIYEYRDINKALQRLRKRGRIVYRKVKDGGKGWELAHPIREVPRQESPRQDS